MALSAAPLLCAVPAFALTEQIMTDPYTGIAIAGYDPVAYFVDGKARQGSREHEVAHGGTNWRFVNRGNAAAFADAPAIYVPAYGGYGVIGVARGIPQPSDPRLFAIVGNRVYLFNSRADLDEFLTDPEGYIAIANERWPKVRNLLAPW